MIKFLAINELQMNRMLIGKVKSVKIKLNYYEGEIIHEISRNLSCV